MGLILVIFKASLLPILKTEEINQGCRALGSHLRILSNTDINSIHSKISAMQHLHAQKNTSVI